MKKRPLDIEALMRVPYVEPDTGYDISPDGKWVAFSWNLTGGWEIYLLPLDGTAAVRQITQGLGAKFAPKWSPEGSRLAYLVDWDGSEQHDILVWEQAADTHTNLTPNTPYAIQLSLDWSPDGQWLALVSDQQGRFDAYVMPATGDAPHLVLDQPTPDWQVTWSPDGNWLAVCSQGVGQEFWIFIVPMGGGEARLLALEGQPLCAKAPCWSPDSRRLAFASNLRGYYDLGIYDLENETITWLTAGEGEKEAPDWSPDGKCIAYTLTRGAQTWLAVQALTSEQPEIYQVEAGVHHHPLFTPDGRSLLVVFDNPRYPCDLWRLNLESRQFHPLTRSLPAAFNPEDFCLPQEVAYPSLDGRLVPALLYRPAGGEKLPPGVLYVHGGPNWLFQIGWDPFAQHMASRGWVVLAPNYRGSTGYGREWQELNRFVLGDADTQDVVAGADYLARESLADPQRLAVTGRSWGGYLTMTCLTQYPDRWVAGSASVPFLNWFTAHKNSREDLQHWDIENFGRREDNYERWYTASPFFFLERITAAVQFICGAHDVRCPASEALQARQALQALGREVDFVLYPDEGHAFLKVETQIDAKRRRTEFLARYLEP
jgi:dipeptidyl aminopeptidase/acylaminoacyl peptidase